MLYELESRVRDLYVLADQAVLRFQAESGLKCPDRCTACCNSDKVEATTLELLPLAFHLCASGQAELLVKRIERHPDRKRCVLFRPDLAGPGGGGCSQYHYRALVCRLFGFAGTVNRNGAAQLARCRHMPLPPQSDDEQNGMAAAYSSLPLFRDFGVAISALHPGLGTIRKPINDALCEAIMKAGLLCELTPARLNCQADDMPPENPFGSPARPRRAA